MKNPIVFAIGFALVSGTTVARAAEFCVNSGNAIRQALAIAQANGEGDTIKIMTGTYGATSGSVAFPFTTNQNGALSIEGGYGIGCLSKQDNAKLTVLSGSGVRQVMRLFATGTGAISVKNLSIEDGEAEGEGAGLWIGGSTNPFSTGYNGSIVVERVILLFNRSAANAGGLAVSTGGGGMTLRGNLLAFNRCGGNHCSLRVESRASSDDPILVYFGGNTVTLNTCNLGASLCDSGGARFTGPQNAVIYDNLFALHNGEDLSLQSPAVNALLSYNNIEVIVGTPTSATGTFTYANPQFIDALAENFRLQPTSPVRNKGNAPYPLPSIDLDGLSRIVDSAPDLGAYESRDALFTNGFDP